MTPGRMPSGSTTHCKNPRHNVFSAERAAHLDSRLRRFLYRPDQLAERYVKPGNRVLDFGCGKGDFCGFLKEKGVSTDYCGIDINDALISTAKTKYPVDEFIALDIDENAFNRTFDIVFVCGVFNLRIAGIGDSMKTILKNLFPRCRIALHVNLLTYYVPQRNVELFYVKPEEMMEFVIREISGSVTLRHLEEDIFLSIYH